MIGGNILGGLGNMMFVIAAIENTALANNTKAVFPNVESHLAKVQNDRARVYPTSDVSTQDYLKIFKNFHWETQGSFTNKIICPFHFVPIRFVDGTIYHGYFQTEKYFTNRNFILNLFEPSEFVLERIEKYKQFLGDNTCAIHVRRGDYSLDQNSKHHTKTIEWYKSAMDIIQAKTYLVFSDDPDYARSNFRGDNFVFISDKDYIELFLMSMCDHNIISSSSFSWWGAWLNKNPNKKVVTPSKWFGTNDPGYIDIDIIPETWIKL